MNHSLPLLFSFRRCPYAMRARMALILCRVQVKVLEISLKAKPAALVAANPRGTVPVLLMPDGSALCESLEIMLWASAQTADSTMKAQLRTNEAAALALIKRNDSDFKPWLDKYKYFDRHPEHSQQYYREQAGEFLTELEQSLLQTPWLLGDKPGLADIGIFPFVRQFAAVDSNWFATAPYPALRQWLERLLATPAFDACMYKYPESPEAENTEAQKDEAQNSKVQLLKLPD
ncbi:glutathione S-transferase [Shewanella sp. JM162201]|uniref:Glutathione S-transferase n=1 Tax=Shewanella jiangmenensis TaxID=2837387 RepID=A0ABS5V1Y6_9GAMM|nr:glutathione S-transferase [Shewanella jiangmenensis]MBT1443930.1 glutathione S-transferase [Shewanella jiangmenensis]